ncbi:glycoside hydrolase superfamily, partial [Cerioporus squamosus]
YKLLRQSASEKHGRDEPHGVKYWALGNEVWGEWQVGQQTASAYSTKARQWAHAIRLVDPNVILVGCGETGINHWDGVVLDELVDKVEMHSVSAMYAHTSHMHQRFAKNVSKTIKLAFDEYGVWDETVGTPEKDSNVLHFADALAMASWLNVFIRQADVVDIACIAQSVNVISPLIPETYQRSARRDCSDKPSTGPVPLLRYMRAGFAVNLSVTSPKSLGRHCHVGSHVKGLPNDLDASAVLVHRPATKASSLRVAVVNRSETQSYEVPLRVAFETVGPEMEG